MFFQGFYVLIFSVVFSSPQGAVAMKFSPSSNKEPIFKFFARSSKLLRKVHTQEREELWLTTLFMP
jgi:hypothetical protein